MFDRHKLSRDGAQAQAVVLEKKVYATEGDGGGGRASACRYRLRVKFEDGSTTETSVRAVGHKLAAARLGEIIPVRYDPADRSKIEIDRHAFVEGQKAEAAKWEAVVVAQGEQALGLSSSATPSMPVADPQQQPDTGDLRIGDEDRELIAEVLGQHMADGRLTTDELDDRLGALYKSQTRAQARAALAGLPPLAPSGGEQHEAVPVLPDWASAPEPVAPRSPAAAPAGRPGAGAAAPVPTDGEMKTAYSRWQAKADKMKADKAALKEAEASDDPRAAAVASMKLKMSRGEEKSARAKLDQLRKRNPGWVAGEGQ